MAGISCMLNLEMRIVLSNAAGHGEINFCN